MTKTKGNSRLSEVKGLLAGDRDLLLELIRMALQEVLEADTAEALGAPRASAWRSAWVTARAITAGAW